MPVKFNTFFAKGEEGSLAIKSMGELQEGTEQIWDVDGPG
jgi:hypothetical protein